MNNKEGGTQRYASKCVTVIKFDASKCVTVINFDASKCVPVIKVFFRNHARGQPKRVAPLKRLRAPSHL